MRQPNAPIATSPLQPPFAQIDKACANTVGRSSRALNTKEKGCDLDDDDRHLGYSHMSWNGSVKRLCLSNAVMC